MTNAGIAKYVFHIQALFKELIHRRDNLYPFLLVFDPGKIESSHNDMHCRQGQLSVNLNIDNAKRLTPQGIGILRAGRNFSTAKCRHDIVDLVCNGNSPSSGGLRQNIASKTRQIVLEHRFRHRLGLT